MATGGIGHPFQGRAWYWVEATFGSGYSATTLSISCYLQDVRIGSGDRSIPIRDIGSAQVCELMQQLPEPTLHIEYHPQAGDTLLSDAVERTSCCTLQSMAFLVEANKCMPSAEDSQFYFVGCKGNTIRISGSKNTPYTIAIDFLAKSVVTINASTATALAGAIRGGAPTPLTGSILTFNLAGSIAKSAGNVARVTNSMDVTINQNLTSYATAGATSLDYLVEGAMDITGSVDITMDDGGATHLTEVLANTAFSLTFTLGAAVGSPIITIPGCEWDNGDIDVNVSGESMISSTPFTAAPVSCVTEGVCITTLITAVE